MKLRALLFIGLALSSLDLMGMGVKEGYQPGINIHNHVDMNGSRAVLTKIGASQTPPRSLPSDAYAFQRTGCIYNGFKPFSKFYLLLCSMLGKPQDFATLTTESIRDARRRGLYLFETIVSPELATQSGADWKEMLQEVDRAIEREVRTKKNIAVGAVLTFINGDDPKQGQEAQEYTEYLVQERDRGRLQHFVGVHLSGAEKPDEDYSKFIPAYDIARQAKLGLAAHAGEWGTASNMRTAIDQLGVTRLGHGIQADDGVIAYLVENGVTLEGCPTSNVCTGALESGEYKDLPFKQLLDAGVSLYACNTDDAALFNDTTEAAEAHRLRQNLGFTDEEFFAMERMGIVASFVPDEQKQLALQVLAKRQESFQEALNEDTDADEA